MTSKKLRLKPKNDLLYGRDLGVFGQRVRARREELRKNISEVARALDARPQVVEDYERGTQHPRNEKLRMLASCLETTVAELVKDLPRAPTASAPVVRAPRPVTGSTQPRRIHVERMPGTGLNPSAIARNDKLAWLDECWADPEVNVVQIIARGGMGKSTVLNQWLARQDNGYGGAELVLVWSSYSQGLDETSASAEVLIDTGLETFLPEVADSIPRAERVQQLLAATLGVRTLLVIDGLESLQNPPDEGMQGGRLRSPMLEELLRGLATGQHPGLCVLTSRLPVVELKRYEGQRVRTEKLGALGVADGVRLLKLRGVRGTDDDLGRAVEECGGHPFTLSLLARVLASEHKGDVRRREQIGLMEGVRPDERTNRLMRSYEPWLEEHRTRAVLRLMGLFDRPAPREALEMLCAEPPIVGLTDGLVHASEADWNRLLHELVRLELLEVSGEAVNTHPIVRKYFKEQLQAHDAAAWQEANRRLYEFFKQRAPHRPSTLTELSPLYLAVMHGCRAGRHPEVFRDVMWERINRQWTFYSTRVLCAVGTQLAALRGFFETPYERPIRTLDPHVQLQIACEASYYLWVVGQIPSAIRTVAPALQALEATEFWWAAALVQASLSILRYVRGELHLALETVRRSVELTDDYDLVQPIFDDSEGRLLEGQVGPETSAFYRASARKCLAAVLHARGEDCADTCDEIARYEGASEGRVDNHLCAVVAELVYCELILEIGDPSDVRARAARMRKRATAWSTPTNTPFEVAAAWLLEGEVLRRESKPAEAENKLQQAASALVKAGHYWLLPLARLRRAGCLRELGNAAQALDELEETLQITQVGGMKLFELQALRELATVHAATGDADAAVRAWHDARQIASEHGYEIWVQRLKGPPPI